MKILFSLLLLVAGARAGTIEPVEFDVGSKSGRWAVEVTPDQFLNGNTAIPPSVSDNLDLFSPRATEFLSSYRMVLPVCPACAEGGEQRSIAMHFPHRNLLAVMPKAMPPRTENGEGNVVFAFSIPKTGNDNLLLGHVHIRDSKLPELQEALNEGYRQDVGGLIFDGSRGGFDELPRMPVGQTGRWTYDHSAELLMRAGNVELFSQALAPERGKLWPRLRRSLGKKLSNALLAPCLAPPAEKVFTQNALKVLSFLELAANLRLPNFSTSLQQRMRLAALFGALKVFQARVLPNYPRQQLAQAIREQRTNDFLLFPFLFAADEYAQQLAYEHGTPEDGFHFFYAAFCENAFGVIAQMANIAPAEDAP